MAFKHILSTTLEGKAALSPNQDHINCSLAANTKTGTERGPPGDSVGSSGDEETPSVYLDKDLYHYLPHIWRHGVFGAAYKILICIKN